MGGVGGTPGGAAPDAGPGIPAPPPRGPVAFVAVSADGGRTFGPPVNTGQLFFDMRIAGTGSGGAVLALVGESGLAMVRTDDGGRTWQAPAILASSAGGNLTLAAAGSRVALLGNVNTGPGMWVSADGGRSFTRRSPPGDAVAVRIDPATGALTMAGFNGQLWLRRSTDAGATFSDPVPIPLMFGGGPVVLSPRFLFAVDKGTQVLVAPLDDLARTRSVDGLPPTMSFIPVLVPDAADNLTLLTDGGVARRLAAGGTTFSAPVSIGNPHTPPGGVALSDKAVAVVMNRNGQIFVAVETWP